MKYSPSAFSLYMRIFNTVAFHALLCLKKLNIMVTNNKNIVVVQVPLPKSRIAAGDLPDTKMKECYAALSKLRIDKIQIQLSSPSLLHLYYNSSYENYSKTGLPQGV